MLVLSPSGGVRLAADKGTVARQPRDPSLTAGAVGLACHRLFGAPNQRNARLDSLGRQLLHEVIASRPRRGLDIVFLQRVPDVPADRTVGIV